MLHLLKRYAHWLHLRWPAGGVERLPKVGPKGRTRIPGVFIAGDLTGIPLLKMSLQSAAEAVEEAAESLGDRQGDYDIVILGGGVAGVAAAIEAGKRGLSHLVIENSQLFNTIANFPAGKPIYTYPSDMEPDAELTVEAEVKEDLLAELRQQADEADIQVREAKALSVQRRDGGLTVELEDADPVRGRSVIIAIGRSGDFRRLGIPGEELGKVNNRLHDPKHHAGRRTLVVGGGDSACEAAIAIAECNEEGDEPLVTLAYRGDELTRPKPDNSSRVHELADQGRLELLLRCVPERIAEDEVVLGFDDQDDRRIANDDVLVLIGREPPLGFFRRSGLPIHGEFSWTAIIAFSLFSLAAVVVYGMKMAIWPFALLNDTWANPGTWMSALGDWAQQPDSLAAVTLASASGMAFWVTFAYSAAVVGFGIDRIQRRRTPYVTVQTLVLMSIQVLPLFILPEIILPWMAANDWMPATIEANLFPDGTYWRAYGFILAWPLMIWNVFTPDPLWWWLGISVLQTLVIIPLLIWRWGKGAYCGWICSCGALAETVGDRHREKMPHGPIWNRMNFVGQALLLLAVVILVLRIVTWAMPGTGSWLDDWFIAGFWKHAVDYALAGALGVGAYFWLSGRVWCRFACPLAALMHIYTRFSRFRIVVDQKKCISCNACTSVCHQGIDVMNFANKGEHMADPECVRCSACVQTCPTGVLQFGRVDGEERVVAVDRLTASHVVAREREPDRG